MTKKAHKQKMKKQLRCAYSGKLIRNQAVILEKYAIEYVKKLGYLVSNVKFIFIFILFLASLFLVSAVSDDWLSFPNQNYTLSFTNGINNFSASVYNNSHMECTGDPSNSSYVDFYYYLLSPEDGTICSWFFWKGDADPGAPYVFRSGTSVRTYMEFPEGSNVFRCTKGNPAQSISSTSIPVNDTRWHFGCCSWEPYNGTDYNFSAYLDGINLGSKLFQNNDSSLANYIGTHTASYQNRFNGSVDEFRAYRRALSLVEIVEINSSGRFVNSSLPSANLTLWISFEEQNLSTSYDKSPFGYNGTNYNYSFISEGSLFSLTNNTDYVLHEDTGIFDLLNPNNEFQQIYFDYLDCEIEYRNRTIIDWWNTTACINGSWTQNITYEQFDYNDCGYVNQTFNATRVSFCSDRSLFFIDTSSTFTLGIILLLFAIAFFLFITGHHVACAGLTCLLGFTLLFSNFNATLSGVIIALGFLTLFVKLK